MRDDVADAETQGAGEIDRIVDEEAMRAAQSVTGDDVRRGGLR